MVHEHIIIISRLGLLGTDEEIHIDIDTFDDSEPRIRDSLAWEASSNQPSPADSTSTTNSGMFIILWCLKSKIFPFI